MVKKILKETAMQKALVLAALLMFLLAGSLFAVGEARLSGVVVDAAGKPIPDVTITIAATEVKTFNDKAKTDKDGRFAIFLLDGTIHYKMVFSKEGFTPYEEVMKLKLAPEKNERTFTLNSGTAVTTTTTTTGKPDPAIVAYNDGVDLANAGKNEEAIAKFEEALKLKPELSAADIALTKMYGVMKNWPKAIEYGNKALQSDPEDADVAAVLAKAYAMTGDKAKAAEFKKKAPANPIELFNEAATHINAGRDSEAEPLLKKAIEADPTLAKAYYELGMVYVRMQKNAEARQNLQKFIELDPKSRDAATAKDMLNYVK
jgi:tetratricopeptide (TPR) repeat protein